MNDGYIVDEIGGFHNCGIGWNPNGVWCGECSKTSCKGCPNENEVMERQKKNGRDVWVNVKTDKLREEECLCLTCYKLRYCDRARELLNFRFRTGIAMMITRCPDWVKRDIWQDNNEEFTLPPTPFYFMVKDIIGKYYIVTRFMDDYCISGIDSGLSAFWKKKEVIENFKSGEWILVKKLPIYTKDNDND